VAITYENHLPDDHPLDAVNLTLDPTTFEAGADFRKNRAVPHLHGGFVPWQSDGGPRSWFLPDGSHGPLYRGNEFIYPNAQRATLMFYHDHAQGLTRLNAYAGIAAAYVVGDEQEDGLVASGAVPALADTVFLVMVDRSFFDTGDLWYPNTYGLPFDDTLTMTPSVVPEAFFDVMTVNGAVYPFKEVNKRRYRLRMLNACNARFLKLRLVEAGPDGLTPTTIPGPPFVQIGTEGGFLPGPVTFTHAVTRSPLTLGCAERADIIIDFRNCDVGKKFILVNEAGAPFPEGSPEFDLLDSGPGASTS
jgi:spore coat protein A